MREEDTFAAQTGQLLAGELGNHIQVINGGVNGYSTYQELAYYRYYGRPLEPDLVVLCFFPGNDFRDNMVHTRQANLLNPVLLPAPERYARRHAEPFLRTAHDELIPDPLSGEPVLRPARGWVEWLEGKLVLARLLGSRLTRLQGQRTGDLELLDLHRYYLYEIGLYQQRDEGLFRTARELALECVEQLNRLVRADGAELLVVVLPAQNQVDPQHWQRYLGEVDLVEEELGSLDMGYPNRLIQEFCAARTIPCLDLTEAFSAVDAPEDLYLTVVGDGHFSPAGHHLAAWEMATFLKQRSALLQAPEVNDFRLGLHRAQQADWAGAEKAFLAGLEHNRRWAPLYVELGDLYGRLAQWTRAGEVFGQALVCDLGSARAWEGLAEVLLARPDTAGAIAVYRQARQARPNWWPYDEELQHLYAARGMTREAEQARRRVEAIFTAPEQIKQYWWAEHTFLGTHYAARGQWQRAEREFERSTRLIPDEPAAYYNLGMLYQKTGRPDQALAAYRQALKVAPDFQMAAVQLRELQGTKSPNE